MKRIAFVAAALLAVACLANPALATHPRAFRARARVVVHHQRAAVVAVPVVAAPIVAAPVYAAPVVAAPVYAPAAIVAPSCNAFFVK
jgi:2-oxoglutarate dehydrogenase E2 component (dihydrolipoamide succinyltransferase)